MDCPICHSTETKVIRTDAQAESVRRRRECLRCGHRYSTVECAEDIGAQFTELKRRLAALRELIEPTMS
jgi:transcriptional regulator NrdR family protein